ncbi:MAG: hypothetical protein H7Y17_14225 [Chlorobia bacterium]|nr:hypothetical protein [Fimbriimonadaceae bacterium]
MTFIIAGIAAIVALIGGVLAKVDPISCLTRALLAFFLGWIAAQLWQVILVLVGQGRRSMRSTDDEAEEVLPAA